jgi:hypothetical protein
MSTTVARPRRTRPATIAGVAVLAALVATFGTLLLFGVFDDDGTEAPRSTAAPVTATPSSGVDQARQQMNERRLQHGAAALTASELGHGAAGYDPTADSTSATSRAGAPIAGTGGATRYGDTKYDLAHPEDAAAAVPTAAQLAAARAQERQYMSGGDTKDDLAAQDAQSYQAGSAAGAGH